MAGTESSFQGMPNAVYSNTNVGHGVNLQNADRGNANGDVVDNTQAENPLAEKKTDPGNARGAYLKRYSKPGALYPNS